MITKGSILTAVFIVSAAACAQTMQKSVPDKDVLLYCSFDGTLKPTIQRGQKGFSGTTPAEFTRGLKGGKALVTGHAKNAIYPVKGNVNLVEGTIKFWVMPIDWKWDQDLFHLFLQFSPPAPGSNKKSRQFDVLLYKYLDWRGVAAYGMAGELTGSNILLIPMAETWVSKMWHQIVFTWDKQGDALYVDGEGKKQKYLQGTPDALTVEKVIVGGPYFIENKTLTAINEFYILNRALSADEVKQSFKTELVEGLMTHK